MANDVSLQSGDAKSLRLLWLIIVITDSTATTRNCVGMIILMPKTSMPMAAVVGFHTER
ncbi:MAG: hypothetical protein WCQ66_09375 [Sphaerochaetaceae bacterium]